MAKLELGLKRICGACGAKFYDLNKSPIVCPKCSTVFEVLAAPPARPRPEAAAPRPAAAPTRNDDDETNTDEADVELVSLEDAEGDDAGKNTGTDDDIDLDDDIDDDDTFLEEEEEEDDDVSDLIGDGIEDDDEG